MEQYTDNKRNTGRINGSTGRINGNTGRINGNTGRVSGNTGRVGGGTGVVSHERRPHPARTAQERQAQAEAIAKREALREKKKRQIIAERRRKRHQMQLMLLSIFALVAIVLVGGVLFWILDVNHLEEGILLYESGNYEEAIVEFQEEIAEEKELGEAYLGIALCSWELEDYETMESAFNSAYANGAIMTGSSRNMLASLALQEEDYEAALSYIQVALSLSGNSDELTQELLRNEIVCYEMLAMWDEAKEKMEEYIAVYPEDEDAALEAEFLETR